MPLDNTKTVHKSESTIARCRSLLNKPIAHRGLHSETVPENSLAAFQWAIDCNLPIECDVQILADGRLVVFHDAELERLTGIRHTVASSRAKEISDLRLLETDERIPFFEDLLTIVGDRVPLLIELKSQAFLGGELERRVIEVLEQHTGDYYIQSFQYESVLWLRYNAPHIKRGQLSSRHKGVPFHSLTQPHFVAYELNSLPHEDTTHLRAEGVPLLAWTITSRADQTKATELADNYIFNQSAEIMESLRLGEEYRIIHPSRPFPSHPRPFPM